MQTFLLTGTVARLLGVSATSVERFIKSGKLPIAGKAANQKLIDPKDLEDFEKNWREKRFTKRKAT